MKGDKKEVKAQIKKDKARLKELKKKDKQGCLTDGETWEYSTLLFQKANRNWDVAIKLGKAAIILLVLAGVVQVIRIVLRFVLY